MFRALLHREWRDARAVTIASAVIVLLASIALNAWGLHWKEGALTAIYLVPALVGLYAILIASDLVAGDLATRRIETLAVLPSGLLRLWTAKALFAVLACAVFLAWVVAAELAILRVYGVEGQVGTFLDALPNAIPHLGVVLALLAAVLFFSTLFESGFGAVLAGLVVIGSCLHAWRATNWMAWGIRPNASWTGWLAAAVAAVFFAGSAVAFVKGPAHGRVLRRTLAGAAVPLGVFLPAAALAAIGLHGSDEIRLGDRDIQIESIDLSPDGTHILVTARRWFGNGSSHLGRSFVVRVRDGHVGDWLPSGTFVLGWTDDGLVWTQPDPG